MVVTKTPAERAFLGLTRTGALVVLAVIALVGLFLTIKAVPALRVAKFSFLTTQAWEPDVHHFGIAGIITGTVLIALVAVVIAVPVSLGLSLYISEVAPTPIRRTRGSPPSSSRRAQDFESSAKSTRSVIAAWRTVSWRSRTSSCRQQT